MTRSNTQQRLQVWLIRLIATAHFVRLLVLLIASSLNIYMYLYNGFSVDPLLLTAVIPIFILELLFGFLILMRKVLVLYPATVYTFFALLFTSVMHSGSPYNILLSLLFYPSLSEAIMLFILGVGWIKAEWVHDSID